jgi:Sulfotransferase family
LFALSPADRLTMITTSINSPVFILGCGRSGTTILGNLLAQHPGVTYLHERRDLWTAAYPETDIWTEHAVARHGKLVFTESDENPKKTRALRKLFALELRRSRRPILIEKLPINNFRLPFIRKMFPDCRLIHIWRNGLEVAQSIEAMSIQGRWFRLEQYRWNLLAEYAQSMPETAHLPALCQSYYEKGLLEWRVSTEAAMSFLERLPQDNWLELSYSTFVADPFGTSERIADFLHLAPAQTVRDFIQDHVSRRSESRDGAELTQLERLIGGPLLEQSVKPHQSGLTRPADRQSVPGPQM